MGNEHGEYWKSGKKRKILILSFEYYYTKKALSIFAKNGDIKTLKKYNFYTEDITYKSFILNLWILSPENRHFWKHHFLGTQGIILIFSFKDTKIDPDIKNEVLNILHDNLLNDVPILIIYDTNEPFLHEDLNSLLTDVHQNERDFEKFWVEEIDFEQGIVDVKSGLNWISRQLELITL